MPQDFPDWVAGVSPGTNIVLDANPTINAGASYNSGWLDVSRFNQLPFVLSPSAGSTKARLLLEWAQDPAGSSTLYFERIWYKNTDVQTRDTVQTQGPFCRFTVDNNSAVSMSPLLQVQGLTSPFLLPPKDHLGGDPLIAVGGGSYSAGGVQYPAVMMPGGMRFWFQDNAVASQLFIVQYWNGTAWTDLYLIDCATSAVPQDGRFAAPVSDWRVLVNSTTTTAFMGVTPD